MEIPTDVKEKILKLKNKLPEDKQDRFVSNMKGGFEKLTESNMTSSALIGAILGSVIDFIPGSGFVSDDWTEIGAAIGAFIGYRKDNKKTFENGITGIKLVCFAVEIIPGILTLLITRQHEKHVIHACCLKSKSVTGGL